MTRIVLCFMTVLLLVTLVLPILQVFAGALGDDADQNLQVIVIDGNDYVVNNEGEIINTYNGWGAVSCNNTSRLLLDYKEEQPEAYWRMMNLLFNPLTGAGLSNVKVEMGADVNTSSGTEPATKRSAREPANVLRGAGWHFAADAKSINPDLTVEILRWGEPAWTGANFEQRYQWYKETIDAVYDIFDLKIDYISPGQNERNDMSASNTLNLDWILYFAQRLKSETDTRYDYSQIKIVVADTYRKPETATLILANQELLELTDVFSYHYDLNGHPSLTRLSQEHGVPVWYGEGIAPMVKAQNRINVDPDRGGIGGTTGVVDIAQRFINMYHWSGSTANPARMTKFMFQPAIISNYQGAEYNPKDLISAHDPWSGYYEVDAGIQMIQHFNWFIDSDWTYLEAACYGDGNWTDGGVAVDSSSHNYLTLKDPDSDDFTMIHANNTAKARHYQLKLRNLATAGDHLYLWETRGPGLGENIDANWMQQVGVLIPLPDEDGYSVNITVNPYSILTISSLEAGINHQAKPYISGTNDTLATHSILELPYYDDFSYADYPLEENGRTYLER